MMILLDFVICMVLTTTYLTKPAASAALPSELGSRAVNHPTIGSDFTEIRAGQNLPVIGANFEGFPASIDVVFALDTPSNILPPTPGGSPVYIFNGAWTTLVNIPSNTGPGLHILIGTLGSVTCRFVIQVCGTNGEGCSPRIAFIDLDTEFAEPLFLFTVGEKFRIDGDDFHDNAGGVITLWIDRNCLLPVGGACAGTQFRSAGYTVDGHISFQEMTMPSLAPGLHQFTAVGANGEEPSLFFIIE